ncbi:MAG: membrane protein insertase YidC, partial [Flavobacterium sp.]|nr:membrane protein insertase YidC [Flavobacterium sp.]
MEEKKLDAKSIVGFVLIAGLMIWMMFNNIEKEKKSMAADAEKAKTEKVEKARETAVSKVIADTSKTDSLRVKALQGSLGAFAYSASLPSAKENVTEVSNGVLTLKIANKGGYITEATINGFEQFSKDSKKQVALIQQNNANLNLQIHTQDNRILNTKDLYFEPTVTKEGANDVVTMRLKAGANQFLEYRYVLKPKEYMMDFAIRSQGLSSVVNTAKPLDMEWQLK